MGKLPTTTTQILASVRGFKKKKKADVANHIHEYPFNAFSD